MIESMFFLNLAFLLAPIWYDEQSTFYPGKQLSQFASIECYHPRPPPFPLRNGVTSLSATWSLNRRTLHVQRLKNMHVIYLGRHWMTYILTSCNRQLLLLPPLPTLRLGRFCGDFLSSISG